MSEQQASAPSDFELMDREDEEQILAELRGVPVDKFIYKNKRGEFELTYAGTKWVVRQMAEIGEAIRVDTHPKTARCEIDPEYLTCTVLGKRVKVDREAKSETVLDSNIGSARQWSKQKINSGTTIIPDEHFFSKVVSRATRNLQLSMIPTDFKKQMIAKLVEMQGKGGGGQQQRPPQGQQQSRQQSGPPDDHDQAPPQRQQESQPQKQQTQQAPPKQETQKQQSAPAQGGTPDVAVVQQHFRAIFTAFAKTEDKPTLQKMLKALTGKTAVIDLEVQVMKDLGPLLRKVVNNELKWTGTAIQAKDGTQIYPKPPPKQEPTAPASHGPPETEPMF